MGLIKKFSDAVSRILTPEFPETMRSMRFVSQDTASYKVTRYGHSDGFYTTMYKEPKISHENYNRYTYLSYEARKVTTAEGPQYKLYRVETVSIPRADEKNTDESNVAHTSGKTVMSKEEAIAMLKAFDNTMSNAYQHEIANDAAHTRKYYAKYQPKI